MLFLSMDIFIISTRTHTHTNIQTHQIKSKSRDLLKFIYRYVYYMERMGKKDLREEVGTIACIVGTIINSRLEWAGAASHMVKMKYERLPKIYATNKHEVCRKRGRPQWGWEDCAKRDLKKGRGGRKVEGKWQQQWAMKAIPKVAYSGVTNDQPGASIWKLSLVSDVTKSLRARNERLTNV